MIFTPAGSWSWHSTGFLSTCSKNNLNDGEVLEPLPTELVSVTEYSLLLRFDNRELRRFDAEPYLADSFFAPLRNRVLLAAARCNGLKLEWSGGIDICPDELYVNSVPAT